MKTLRNLLPLLACASFLMSCRPEPANLLLIITDDQGYGDLSLHGNKILETPHLDAIGLTGTRLDNFHVSPVCAPTRAALLTGRRPMSTGAYYVTRGGEVMDDQEYTLAEVLKDNGYATGCFGKWHNGAHHPCHPLSQGFDEFFGFTAGHWNRYFDPELEHNGKMVRTSGYIADILTDRAIDFIKSRRNGPFFCYLAYNTPHSPFQVPDEYFTMYIDRVDDKDSLLRISNASVYGMVRNIDDNVGRMMETLEDLGLEESTIVVFLTDNGPNTVRFNGHMKGRKGWVNDGGVRVPCFFRWKGHVPENKVVTSMTAHIDLLPTLVSLMDLEFEPGRELHGIDLTPRIMGADLEEERFLFTHVNHGVEVQPAPGAVRTPEWRLTFLRAGEPELTRRSDSGELINLSDSLKFISDSLTILYYQWFDSFKGFEIPPVPVGVIDSVVLPAHEGFLNGGARYFWSENGWANDWVTALDEGDSYIYWPIEVVESGAYLCDIRYTAPSGNATVTVEVAGMVLYAEAPAFLPVQDRNYSRTDRPAEAIGQSWGRAFTGVLRLPAGEQRLALRASDPDVEILEVILKKNIN